MNITQIAKDFANSSFFPITWDKLNYSCITDLQNSNAPEYIKKTAAAVVAVTKFTAPLARAAFKSLAAGYLIYEGTHFVTKAALKELSRRTKKVPSVHTLMRMKFATRLLGYSAGLGALVGPITPFSALLIVSAGVLRGTTHHYLTTRSYISDANS